MVMSFSSWWLRTTASSSQSGWCFSHCVLPFISPQVKFCFELYIKVMVSRLPRNVCNMYHNQIINKLCCLKVISWLPRVVLLKFPSGSGTRPVARILETGVHKQNMIFIVCNYAGYIASI